jgi:hypothetical protein
VRPALSATDEPPSQQSHALPLLLFFFLSLLFALLLCRLLALCSRRRLAI